MSSVLKLISLWLAFAFIYFAHAETPSPTPAVAPVSDSSHFKIETDEKIWKKISDQEGVRTYQERISNHDVVAFRGETTMPVPLERIVTVLRDEKIRKEWIDALVEQKTLEHPNSFEQVDYNHTKVPWPFQDRDFVYRAKVSVESGPPRSLSIVMTSEQNPLKPEQSGIVRGQIIRSFYYMKEVPGPEPKTDVLIEMALDPKGAIPMWMVNLTQKRWPHNTLLALRKLSSRPDLVVPKEILDYFNPTKSP